MTSSASLLWGLLLASSCAIANNAHAAVRTHRLCAELEPRTGAGPSNLCYVGAPCVIGLRGDDLAATNDATLTVLANGAGLRASILGTGEAASPPTAHCAPAAAGAREPYIAIRTPVLEQPGGYMLTLQRPALFGISSEYERLSFRVVASHGFLDPRQSAASETARLGESKIFTFSGRNLAALRIRPDAPALQPTPAYAARARPLATDVQWMHPEQKQIRVRLTLYRAGQVSTRELFEFIGSGESPINRDLGWPVIDVLAGG